MQNIKYHATVLYFTSQLRSQIVPHFDYSIYLSFILIGPSVYRSNILYLFWSIIAIYSVLRMSLDQMSYSGSFLMRPLWQETPSLQRTSKLSMRDDETTPLMWPLWSGTREVAQKVASVAKCFLWNEHNNKQTTMMSCKNCRSWRPLTSLKTCF